MYYSIVLLSIICLSFNCVTKSNLALLLYFGVNTMVKNLRKLRMSKGVSQQTLADYLGIAQQSFNRYEKDKIEPDIASLILLADYFNTTVDYLIGHTPPEDPQELELTKDEWALLRDYRQLSESERESIRLVINNYLKE